MVGPGRPRDDAATGGGSAGGRGAGTDRRGRPAAGRRGRGTGAHGTDADCLARRGGGRRRSGSVSEEFVAAPGSSARSGAKFATMPLWTTATRPALSRCGWALASVGPPWVAQRVWPMPVAADGSGCSDSSLSRLTSLPARLAVATGGTIGAVRGGTCRARSPGCRAASPAIRHRVPPRPLPAPGARTTRQPTQVSRRRLRRPQRGLASCPRTSAQFPPAYRNGVRATGRQPSLVDVPGSGRGAAGEPSDTPRRWRSSRTGRRSLNVATRPGRP
ncbi:hypothetical protein SVIOM342S_00108 [Streptomyces violaceorubidus]